MKQFILFLFCFPIAALRAQPGDPGAAPAATSDTARVLMLEEISRSFLNSRPDSSFVLSQEGLMLSRKAGFRKGEAISLNRIGTVLASSGNYPQALEKLLEALAINEKINNYDGLMRNLGNIAIIYSEQHDDREALNYSFKELAIAKRLADTSLLISTLLSIGDSYDKLNRYDSARFYAENALVLATRLDDYDDMGVALNNLGNAYTGMGKPDAAMMYYRSSLYYYNRENDSIGICESALGVARILRATNPDSSFYYAMKSYTTATNQHFTKYTLDASRLLTDYFCDKKRMDSAFHYQKISIEANQALFNQENTRQVQNLSFREKIRQQAIEEEKIRVEKERKDNLQLVGIAAVIVTLFLFLLLLSRRKTKAKTVEVYGLIVLLLLFEYIALYIHPLIEELTHHTPVLMMMILVAVAAILVPLHHKMEKWVKEKLAHKIQAPAQSPSALVHPHNQGRDSEVTP